MNKLINTDAHEIRDGERRFKIRPCLTAKDNPQTVARSLLLSPIPWLCISNAMWYEMKSHDEIPMTKIPIPRQRGPPTNRSAPFSGWVQLRPQGPLLFPLQAPVNGTNASQRPRSIVFRIPSQHRIHNANPFFSHRDRASLLFQKDPMARPPPTLNSPTTQPRWSLRDAQRRLQFPHQDDDHLSRLLDERNSFVPILLGKMGSRQTDGEGPLPLLCAAPSSGSY